MINSLLRMQKNTLDVLPKKLKLKELLKSLLKKQTISLLQMRRVALLLAISISKIRISTTG